MEPSINNFTTCSTCSSNRAVPDIDLNLNVKIVTALLACLLFAGLNNAQSCLNMEEQGRALYNASKFHEAAEVYHDARDCHVSERQFEEAVNAGFYELDCLTKAFQFNAYRTKERALRDFVKQHEQHFDSGVVGKFSNAFEVFAIRIHTANGHTERALELIDSLLLIPFETSGSPDRTFYDQRRIQYYLTRANVNRMTGDYRSAIADNRQALNLMPKYLQTYVDDGIILTPHLAIADCYAALGDHARVVAEYDSLRTLIPRIKQKQNERIFDAWVNIFSYYLPINRDSAGAYLQQLRHLDFTSRESQVLLLSAQFEQAGGNYEASTEACRRALAKIEEEQGLKSNAAAQAFLLLGQNHLAKGALSEALAELHMALEALTDHQDDNPATNPSLPQLYRHRDLLDILWLKSRVMLRLYTDAHQPAMLEHAWETIDLAVRFLGELRVGFVSSDDRRLIIDQGYRVFEQALGIATLFYERDANERWIDTAFALMEQSKGLNLLNAVLHERAKDFAGIPDSLLREEARLRRSIADRTTLLANLRAAKDADQAVINRHLGDLESVRRKYDLLIRAFETDYPKYYQLKHDEETVSADEIRQTLSPTTSLIEYFVGDSATYAVYLDRENKYFDRLGSSVRIVGRAESMRSALNRYLDSKARQATRDYLSDAAALYTVLLAPFADALKQDVVIIPDGALGLISFAGLLRQPAGNNYDLRELPYLLWDHNIVYCYSANLLDELRIAAKATPSLALSCAPAFSDAQELEHNQAEAEYVRDLMGGDVLLGEHCTSDSLESLLRGSNAYGILHLATHGDANPENGEESYIALAGAGAGSRLYAHRLYEMSIEAHLVYLAACETGSGEWRRGEGIVSFARAFFYAGAKSLVTPLWRIEDQRASTLSRSFYQHLHKNQHVHAAVASAQRSYIKQLPDTRVRDAHPAYWSALIAIGNTQPLGVPFARRYLIWISLSVLVTLTAGYFFSKKVR